MVRLGALRATVLDARRGEVYGAVYDAQLDPVIPETVMSFESWLKTIPARDVEFISIDFTPFRNSTPPEIPVVTAPRALAGAIGRIAWNRFQAGQACNPGDVDANYVRRSDAELFWRE